MPIDLTYIAAKLQQKARESVQSWLVQLWDIGGHGISWTGQRAKRMNNITTHPVLWQHLQGTRKTEVILLKIGLF